MQMWICCHSCWQKLVQLAAEQSTTAPLLSVPAPAAVAPKHDIDSLHVGPILPGGEHFSLAEHTTENVHWQLERLPS